MKWDIQVAANFWFSLGIHIDHAAPYIAFHLPGLIILVGRCYQPGLAEQLWSLRDKSVKAYTVKK